MNCWICGQLWIPWQMSTTLFFNTHFIRNKSPSNMWLEGLFWYAVFSISLRVICSPITLFHFTGGQKEGNSQFSREFDEKVKDRKRLVYGLFSWQIYCSWIQCTMFWWHGALFCGFNFDAAGQWGQKGQKQPVKFIPVSLLFSPVPEFPEGFWHLFCVVLFFTAAAFQDPLNGLCRIQGQTSSKSLPQLNYSIPDEQVAWLLFAN